MDEKINLKITVRAAKELLFESKCCRDPSAYVSVQVNDTSATRTAAIWNTAEPCWNHDLLLVDVALDSKIRFDVFDDGLVPKLRVFSHKREKDSQDSLGYVEAKVSDLIQPSATDDMVLTLSPRGSLTIRVETLTAESSLGNLHLGEPATEATTTDPFDRLDELEPFSSVSASLQDIVSSLKVLVEIVRPFAELNSFVHTAVEAVTSLLDSFQKELDNERRIKALVGQMKRLYAFVNPLASQSDRGLISALENVLRAILKQTVECVFFIQGYARRSLIKRSVSNLVSGEDTDKIKSFLEVFIILAKCLDTGAVVSTTLISLRIEGDVREMSARMQNLEDEVAELKSQTSNLEKESLDNKLRQLLMPISYDDWESRPRCQADTCVEPIKHVVRWVLDTSSTHKLLFIRGMVGTGKSTLATTIADYFAQLNRLGAFIYFNRDMPEKNRSLGVIRALSYQLCQFDCRILDKVMTAIKNNARVHNMPLKVQFQDLISTPLNSVEAIAEEGPILIMIDALDECSEDGHFDSRRQLFEILSTNIGLLPSTVRVIITSRTERSILNIFDSQLPQKGHITAYELDVNPKDIEFYIRRELSSISDLDPALANWPDEQQLRTLVQRANGLFIWAATACKFIASGDYPDDNLTALTNDTVAAEPLEALYLMYAKALKSAGEWKQGSRFTQDACAIIGLVLIAKTPLTSNIIDKLLKLNSSRVIDKLGSVLRRKDGPIRILHSSFADYLSTCTNEVWYIDQGAHTVTLAQNCLSLLSSTYPTVDLRNKRDVLDGAAVYASTYWVTHVVEMRTCPEGFDSKLLEFLEQNLLIWLEAMSGLNVSWRCANLLETLLAWAKEFTRLPSLQELIYDGVRFASFFAATIAAHPSLIRLSALPFAPTESRLYQLFHNARIPTVLGGYQRRWSKSLRVLKQQDERFYSLSFSSDGTKFLSCSSGRISRWDPLMHSERVSPTQELVAPSLIRLWDTSTGLELIPAHVLDAPCTVAFSVNDTAILSASAKGTVTQLNAVTGKPDWQMTQKIWALHDDPGLSQGLGSNISNELDLEVKHPAFISTERETLSDQLHVDVASKRRDDITFGRMSFSPDKRIVIFGGSSDSELCVVNLRTRRQMYPTLYAGNRGLPKPTARVIRLLQSIAFSPDSEQFAVGTSNGTILMYRTRDGKLLVALKKHTSDVTVLEFMHDRLISSALDGTIRIWNLNGEQLQETIIESKHQFQPLAIDPLGKTVFSSTENGTIYAWDLSGKTLAAFHDSFHSTSAIALSADGMRMVSAAFQNPIRIWDISSYENIPLSRHDRGPDNVKIFGDGFLVCSSMKAPPRSTKFWDVVTGKELVTDGNDNDIQIDDIVQESPKVHLLDSTTGEIWHRPIDEPWASLIRSMSDKLQLKLRFNVKTNTLQLSEKYVWKLPLEFHCRSITKRGNIITFGMQDGRVISVYLPDTVFQKSLHPELVPVAPTDDRSSRIRRFFMSEASNLEARSEILRPPNLKYTRVVSPPATSQRPPTENRLSIPRRIPPANHTNPRAPLRPISVVQSAVSAPTFSYRDLRALMQSQAGSS